jgi:hypothetical protein
MSATIGKYTTFDSSFLDVEVRGVAELVEASLTTTWDLIPEGTTTQTEQVKWFDAVSNTLEGAVRGASWDAVATTGLGIDDDLAAIINVGDKLLIEEEQVVVASVDARGAGAGEISVHSRGVGNTVGAIHADTTAILIIGNENVEGTVDGDSIIEDNVQRDNYIALVEEPIKVTKISAGQRYEDVQDKVNEARQKALSRGLKKLNRNVLFGEANAGSKTTPRSAGGIRSFLASNADAINIDVAGAFSETVLKAGMLEVGKRGGSANVLLCSPEVKSTINGFNGSIARTTREDNTAGSIIDFYEGEGLGRIAIVADPQLRDSVGEAYLVNTAKLEKMWFTNDTLMFVDETNVNSRTIAETLQGSYTFKMKDVTTDHARFYGIA